MKITNKMIVLLAALLISATSAMAQTQTKTVQMGSNCTVTVTTSVLTNGGGVAVSAMGSTLDPHVIIRALGGQDGGVKMGGHALDPQAIMQVIGAIAGGNTAPDAQAYRKALTSAARAAGVGVITGSTQLSTNPVTWLGLTTDELSADVRAQLTLPEGTGLIVRQVTADSPAAQAGVQSHDILLKLDDQLLINPAQLRTLIHGRKGGDAVALTFLRKGKEHKVTVKLVKRILLAEDDGIAQVINLNTGHLDVNPTFGLMSGGSGTNCANRLNIRAILEAVSNAMQQVQQELNAPAK
jgi:hypothetical protein